MVLIMTRILMWVGKPQGMNLLFMSSEVVQMKERLWAARTGQLNTQVGLAYISKNGHMRSRWSFTAPLNLTLINPLDAPHIQTKGCHVGRESNLQSLRNSHGGDLLCLLTPLSHRNEGLRSSTFRLLGRWL